MVGPTEQMIAQIQLRLGRIHHEIELAQPSGDLSYYMEGYLFRLVEQDACVCMHSTKIATH